MDLSNYSAHENLRDGEIIHIRAICPEDKRRLLEGFSRLSRNSVIYRFLGSKKELTQEELIYFTEIDFEHHIALAATLPHDNDKKIVGVGRYIERNCADYERSAEVALAVVDKYQNRGIGSLLFEKLIEIARFKGVVHFEAYVLADNKRMIDIFKHYGFDVQCSREFDIMHLKCSIIRRSNHS
jgi:GNAT superfamily N-acetyltransferase